MLKPKCFVFAIHNYWNHRHRQVAENRGLQNFFNQAEALEFLVRMVYYVYRVWKVIKANEKYRRWGGIFALRHGIFPSDYSSEFVDRLIAELQVIKLLCSNAKKSFRISFSFENFAIK